MLIPPSLNHFVRQTFHMGEVSRPESKAPVDKSPSVAQKLLHPFVVKNNPLAPEPPRAPKDLKIMSFNVRLGGVDFQGVRRTVLESKADIIGLQEVSRENAEKLAKELGMHLTFYQSVRHNNSLDNGKAILSRYPIKEAETKPFKVSVWDRLKGMWNDFKRSEGSFWDRLAGTSDIWQKRTILRSTFEINGKTIDFIDNHLSTGNEKVTAQQYRQLQEYVQERKRMGHEVIMVGDFNTHMENPEKRPDDPSVKGWEQLQKDVTDAFASSPSVRVTGTNGQSMDPEEARQRLADPNLPAASRKVLEQIAMGATLGKLTGRIDAILSTGGFKASSVFIDQRNTSSDHKPVIATLDFAS